MAGYECLHFPGRVERAGIGGNGEGASFGVETAQDASAAAAAAGVYGSADAVGVPAAGVLEVALQPGGDHRQPTWKIE
jgi:hypothetical protein